MKVRSLKVPGNKFTLYPLSDVHWPNHDHDKLKEWMRAVRADRTAVVTFGGDLFDFARGKYRMHLTSYTADNNSRAPVDKMAYVWVDDMADFLKPIKDKVLMTCAGNHFWGFANGRISDQELVLQLGIPHTWVGAFGMARVHLGALGKVKIALHHDAGRKGGTASADMLAFQHWSHGCSSDIYVAGHTHRQYAGIYQTRITMKDYEDKTGDQKLVFVRSGAFLKGYSESVLDPEAPFIPDYAEVAMLPPSVLGIISVTVQARGDKLLYQLNQQTL